MAGLPLGVEGGVAARARVGGGWFFGDPINVGNLERGGGVIDGGKREGGAEETPRWSWRGRRLWGWSKGGEFGSE